MTNKLKNGCSRTQVFISPKNYKTLKDKNHLSKQWFVECRFYDPRFSDRYPNGFAFRMRFTSAKNITEKKKIAEIYKKEMEHLLDVLHYNPITRVFNSADPSKLSPDMQLINAFNIIRSKMQVSAHHDKQIRCCIARIEKVLPYLGYDTLSVSDYKIWHIKNILDELNLTNSVYNKFRGYLKRLFAELIEYGCAFQNPCNDISKRKQTINIREVFDEEKFNIVFDYLKHNHYEFYRYAMIFYYSGARSSELLRVRKSDVNIEKQEYKALIKKGNQYVWEIKVIIPQALRYWKEILSECKTEEDYLFTRKQLPSLTPIKSCAITRQWARLVKNNPNIKNKKGKSIKITEDFYALKHLFLDKLDELYSESPIIDTNFAQLMASHRSNRTTSIYTIGRKKRINEYLKTIKI